MPLKARIDAAGALHYIIVRGIERRQIFHDDVDRDAFVNRLGQVLIETHTDCFAWALIPNSRASFVAYRSDTDHHLHEKAFDWACRPIQSAASTSWPCFPESIQVHSLPGRLLSERVGPLYSSKPPASRDSNRLQKPERVRVWRTLCDSGQAST